MKRVLVFSFFPAFTPPSNGGESRLLHFYEALSKNHHITLLSSGHLNCPEEKIIHGSNFVERRIPKDNFFVEKYQELLPSSSGGDLSAVCIAACSDRVTLLHHAYLEEYPEADIIIHDSPFTIGYDIFRDIDNKPRVYNSYNCESSLYKSIHPGVKSSAVWEIVKECETATLRSSDLLLYCSKSDLLELKNLEPCIDLNAIFTPHGATPHPLKRSQDRIKNIHSVLFIGSSHPPNRAAAHYIVDELAPVFSDITFHIVGQCLDKGLYGPNVVRHGFLADNVMRPLVSECDLALNPMVSGSGANIKMFDLLESGIPILSTPFGIRGLEELSEGQCLVAELGDFPNVIASWAGRNTELQKVGLAGRALIAERYTWEKIAAPFHAWILEQDVKPKSSELHVLALNDYDSFDNVGGGGVRTSEIYTAVSEWRAVVFICFSNDERLFIHKPDSNITVICVPKSANHTADTLQVNSHYHISSDDIIAARHCGKNAMLLSIYNILRNNAEAIVVEHCYMAKLPMLFDDRFVYSSQNCETQLKSQVLKGHPLAEILVKEVRSLECAVCERAATIIAVSDQDAEEFTKLGRGCGPIITVPNGASYPAVPLETILETTRRQVDPERSLVFVGSAHPPNIAAAQYIVEELAPSLPEFHFHILGSVCAAVDSGRKKNVVFWGEVDEDQKAAIMEFCQLALNPVVTGGGSNIKTADYFANGLRTLTTEFGLRGYPLQAKKYCTVSELGDFNKSIKTVFEKPISVCRSEVKKFFDENLSMKSNAQAILPALQRLKAKKSKVLFVTYRYTMPTLGGAEAYILKLIEALDESDRFQIDVAATKVSRIIDDRRFSAIYSFDDAVSAPVGLKNVRYARFLVDEDMDSQAKLAELWRSTPAFERSFFNALSPTCETPTLIWGWGDCEGDGKVGRWAYSSCGLYFPEGGRLKLRGLSEQRSVLSIVNASGETLLTQETEGCFSIEVDVDAGQTVISTACEINLPPEVRPLAFFVTDMVFNSVNVCLSEPTFLHAGAGESKDIFESFALAADKTRRQQQLTLTNLRGPSSRELDSFLSKTICEYDLIVTHNNIFAPAVTAVAEAKKHGIPVISIPHSHLDDDFYHFPDVEESIVNSDLALIAPKLACDFYRSRGSNVKYHTPGIDTQEAFTDDDVDAFNRVMGRKTDFFLVLGRKAAPKRYALVVDAIESMAKDLNIHLVMIGPDDDGIVLNSPNVSYLGLQPRPVLRGALISCIGLVNMSTSESFGMVLLEAWLAGKPVIVSDKCAAFSDLTVHDMNALVTSENYTLQKALTQLIEVPGLAARLGKQGKKLVSKYDWAIIGENFVNDCESLAQQGQVQRT